MIRFAYRAFGTATFVAGCAMLMSVSLVAPAKAQPTGERSARQDQFAEANASDGEGKSSQDSTDGDGIQRKREGTRLAKVLGYFRTTGEGLTFHESDSKRKYPGLENLALERIAKVMNDRHDHPAQLVWEVSGFFTEFRGGNYLFITHAILKNKSRRLRAAP